MEQAAKSIHTLAVKGRLDAKNLRQNQYTISLLNEAYRVGMMNAEEVNNIQLGIMLVLKELIQRYTKGDSTSVSSFTAESILNSIIYCIDAHTLSCKTPEEALQSLLTSQVRELHRLGVKRVGIWLEEAGELYAKVKKNKLNVGLESYDHTINEDLPVFFNNYGIIFDSHNVAGSIDYQLAFDDMSIRGVLYIKNYLEHLLMETLFLKNFNSRDIENLLCDFGKAMGMDYKIELINIFELVFNNAVFALIAGGIERNLRISKFQFENLENKIKALKDTEIGECIDQAVETLVGSLDINDASMLDYINRYKEVLTGRVVINARNDSLGSIIIKEKEESRAAYKVLFENGKHMGSNEFNVFVKKLMNIKRTEDKIGRIMFGIGSLHDFIDILSSDCLFGDEYEALFNGLGNMELALLAKVVFYEEQRSGLSGFRQVVSNKKHMEAEWQIHYVEFLKKSGEDRLDAIEGLLCDIDYEETSFY